MKNYHSDIPANADERVIETYDDGMKKRAEYYLDDQLAGVRSFHECGAIDYETPYKNGLKHGWEYRCDSPGQVLSAEPYENGLVHGTAYQYDYDDNLVGSYTMHHGTGIDLWWWSCCRFEDEPNRPPYLCEVHYIKDSCPHGFEWWINKDQRSVHDEKHWLNGQLHGIERQWNFKGGLRRGYPRYYIHGERVTKRQYLKHCATDATLPPFREQDNQPYRDFPAEIKRLLSPPQ